MSRGHFNRGQRLLGAGTRQSGFTLLELAFVFIVFGIMVAFAAPSASFLHQKTMAEEDRRMLQSLKRALIGQVLATGQLPRCRSAAGTPSPSGSNCDPQQTLGSLGVRWMDGRGSGFVYDVLNDAGNSIDLTAAGSPGRTVAPAPPGLCNRLDAAITLASTTPGQITGPRICSLAPSPDDVTTYANYCAVQNPVAFVLIGTGANRPGTNGEMEIFNAAFPTLVNRNLNSGTPPARIYENPSRRSLNTYDDLVEVVTLQELRAVASCN
ncbi:type II secretion system protein [Oryzomicrobium sp.]|uniref:type II secretion system protein n=1 Tax=Oryzomicrobium sp. TaxID=1911578 RepID=UPI0025F62940|nr:type II secretion system protein [Oryzomicrobium sp.]MCE1241660.1 type II secretion system GspH family protein [Oryzomicrobium sp.]